MNLYYITAANYFMYLVERAFYDRSYTKELDWAYLHLGITLSL